MEKGKVTVLRLINFYMVLFVVWTLFHFVLSPFIEGYIKNELFLALVEGFIKVAVWTVPAVFYINKYDKDLYVDFRQMFTNKINFIHLTLYAAGIALYTVISSLVFNGKIAANPDLSLSLILSVVVFVGLTEEIMFRGFMLNASLKIMKPQYAVLLNAFMFLCIHFPRWIIAGEFAANIKSTGFLLVFALGALFGYVFIKSKNILVPTILHMLWNLFAVLFK